MSVFIRPPVAKVVGFTLVELLIALATLATLATVTLPAYSDYVRRGQLPEAFGALADYRARMEQYFQDNSSYGRSAGACADDPGAAAWNSFAPVDAKYFRFTCRTDGERQRYTITAIGIAGNAFGHTFTIDQNGDRATTQFRGKPVAATCWLTKDGRC